MADKTFIVTHAKARAPITVTGKTLEAALEKEGLNPAIWKEVSPAPMEDVQDHVEDKGDAGPEDN